MKTIVIYESKYGSTERYARWLAEMLNCSAVRAADVKKVNLSSCETIILGGRLDAGGIGGAAVLKKQWDAIKQKKIVVFTVGLANPANTDYKQIIEKNFSDEQQKAISFFHLRGGIDYQRLGPVHKVMMSMMNTLIKRKQESEISDEDRQFQAAYGACIDFVSKDTLQPIVAVVTGPTGDHS